MFRYTYNELYDLVDNYNKKHKTNIDINELVDPSYKKLAKYGHFDKDLFKKYDPKVIYEDNDFFGIYKPPHWTVNVGGGPNKDTFDVLKNMDKNLLQVWLYKNLKYPLREDINKGY